MDALTIHEAAETTGWSPRMLRYIERAKLIEPRDADLAELAEMARQRARVADLRPQLGRRLHEGAAGGLLGHVRRFLPPRANSSPRRTAFT